MTTTRPVLTVSEAAAACLVTPKTITRRLPRLVELGAEKDSSGQWRIPVEALMSVGLKPGKPKGPDSDLGQPEVSQDNVTPDIRVELATVTTERDMLRELLASERAHRQAVEQSLALALRQIPATVTPDPLATAGSVALEVDNGSTESTVEVTEDGRTSGEVRPSTSSSTPTPRPGFWARVGQAIRGE